jgi:diguanylate cyclase (GGDEF)-like protein
LGRRLRAILSWLGRLPRAVQIALSLLLVSLVFVASYETDLEIRFSFFYLLPIAFGAWFVGRRFGILLSFLSTAAWLAEFLLQRPGSSARGVAYWNAGLLLGFFLVLALLLSVLREAIEREKAAARADPLTHVANRRAFSEMAEAEISRVSRYGGHFTVAYMDLDDFKTINDKDGHEMGDRVLVLVAQAIRSSLRANDIVARLGGDEFIILLPQTAVRDAERVLGKIEAHIAEVMRPQGQELTRSTGMVTFERPPQSVNQMIRVADELMYSAKTSGKNKIMTRIIGA